jgi:hypothetical protein
MKLKLGFLVLAVSGCGSLPPFPEVVQYGVHADVARPGFYGVNTRTSERVYKPFNSPSMKAAQCMSAADYAKSEAWIASVEKIARQRCQ